MTNVFCAFAAILTVAAPAPSFCSWIAPEIADHICQAVADGEYLSYLDYNGDGKLTLADAVLVRRRYQHNITYGNELTIDKETVKEIIEENYSDEVIYWEFDEIDCMPTRQYSITTNKITEVNLYLEFENYCDNVRIEINPFKEMAFVVS